LTTLSRVAEFATRCILPLCALFKALLSRIFGLLFLLSHALPIKAKGNGAIRLTLSSAFSKGALLYFGEAIFKMCRLWGGRGVAQLAYQKGVTPHTP